MWPLPTQFKREDWQVDHTIPLSEGGCDTVVNMQWLPKVIKTCADANCKDRWERKVYQKQYPPHRRETPGGLIIINKGELDATRFNN